MKTMLVIFAMFAIFAVTPAIAKAQHRVRRSFVIVQQPIVYFNYSTSFVRQPVVTHYGLNGHHSFIGRPSFIRRGSFISSPYVAQPVFVNHGFHLSFGRGLHGHRFFSIGF